MKKVLLLIVTFFSFIGIVSANSIRYIDMDIVLDKNGNATITETWDATVNQGTEGWHPYYNLGKSKISVISASMDNKEYSIVSNRNESGSLSAKYLKAGIYNVDSEEVDVVFGISEYGSHVYKVVYYITNFVSNLNDADMIYWQLFPYDFSAQPDNVKIKISGPYEYPDTLDVWGYGMYGAPCYVQNGAIYMTSDGPISSSEYLTILVKFPKGTFETSSVLYENFDYYYNMAQDGSEAYHSNAASNGTDDFWGAVAGIFVAGIQFVVWLLVAIFAIRAGNKSRTPYTKESLELPKDIPNFRDIPCNKDIYRAFWVADTYSLCKSKNDFIGALLLKWIKDGVVTVETIEKTGVFKNYQESTISFIHPPVTDNAYEQNLYKYMLEASGDGKLETNEFKKWCKRNYSKILNVPTKIIDAQQKKYLSNNELIKEPYQRGLIFKYTCHRYIVRDTLKKDAIEMKGLKQFLTEFASMDTKMPIEVMLWDEYLMYAQIFGIADKVIEQFKKFYPEVVTEMERTHFNYNTYYIVHSITDTGVKAASAAKSAAESYSSGGGGFSSGGGGGGSFGGGGGGGGFR